MAHDRALKLLKWAFYITFFIGFSFADIALDYLVHLPYREMLGLVFRSASLSAAVTALLYLRWEVLARNAERK